MKNNTQKIVIAALLTALCCVVTMVIQIPTPLKGYINLGDSVVLIAAWFLSPVYAFFTAGVGSALADALSGYALYIPATFVIKGLMALAAHYCHKTLLRKWGSVPAKLVSGCLAQVIMMLGYLLFDVLLYGFAVALTGVPANLIQGTAGLAVGLLLGRLFEKSKLF